tara:strand:- start:63 stop:323 length:261 start_codon:yes stop_codon:yes gene_type:complete
MKKLETALEKVLANLGLDMDFYNELKADVQAHKLVVENGLLPSTQEDVQDEYEQLETTIEEDEVDEADENEIDMSVLSPTMRAVYK